MLIANDQKPQPAKVKIIIQGQDIPVIVRPWDADEIADITRKNTTYDFALNPRTNKMERVASVDEAGTRDDVLDHLIVGFEGVFDNDKKPWPVDRKHKLLLAFLPVAEGETYVWKAIRDAAMELAGAATEEFQEELKNSAASPGISAARRTRRKS